MVGVLNQVLFLTTKAPPCASCPCAVYARLHPSKGGLWCATGVPCGVCVSCRRCLARLLMRMLTNAHEHALLTNKQYTQLGHLSKFATSIFTDLNKESEEMRKRMVEASERTTALVSPPFLVPGSQTCELTT